MFDYNSWKTSEKSIHDTGQPKQSLRRLEMSLNKCINVVIPLHVEILNKHKSNIEKFRELKEWNNILREQVNASRTVEQLKADIWSLELLRNQVAEEDLAEFDKRTTNSQNLVNEAVRLFIEDSSRTVDLTTHPLTFDDDLSPDFSDVRQSNLEEKLLQMRQETIVEEKLEEHRRVAASCDQLVKDLVDFHEMMTTFAACVHKQQEVVDQIEEHIESAQVNVAEGNRFLAQAVKYKAALYPVTGAVIGGCLGGPLGLLVGLKAGAAALAVGGLVGFQSGRILKRKVRQTSETELDDLTNLNNRASSLPDLRSVGEKHDTASS